MPLSSRERSGNLTKAAASRIIDELKDRADNR